MTFLAGVTGLLRRVLDLALFGLVGVVLTGIVLAKLVPLSGHQPIVVGGGSMEPAIAIGSTIVVAPVTATALAPGDIVSVRVGPSQALYTHRITYVVDRPDGRWIRTKGDANPEPDPTLVPASAVVGRVEMVIPWVGFLITLLSTPTGIVFVLGLAASILAAAWLLESLELEKTERTVVRLPAGLVLAPAAGEPIAVRPLAARSLAALTGRGSTRLGQPAGTPADVPVPRPAVVGRDGEPGSRWARARGRRVDRDRR